MEREGRDAINDLFGQFADGLYFSLERVELDTCLRELIIDVGALREFFAVDDLDIAELEDGDVQLAQPQ
jgi:hypothetical protein